MKDLTTPLEIAQFLIDCANRHGIKTSISTNETDAETKIETSYLAEKEIFNN